MEIQSINYNSHTVRYFRFGNPDGQPFVIIAGVAVRSVMESAEFIRQQYISFEKDYNVYVIDRRTDVYDGYDINDMADDIIHVLDSLSVRNADIYGVSQGGMIAQSIAVNRPDIVRRLVLCSTGSYVNDSALEVMNKWRKFAENHDAEKLMLSFAENVYTPAYCEKYHNAFIKLGELLTEKELDRFSIIVKCTDKFDIRSKLSYINCPLLVIAAENDRIFGTEPSENIAELTGGELYIYKNEAHGVYDENADVLVKIKNFLDKN